MTRGFIDASAIHWIVPRQQSWPDQRSSLDRHGQIRHHEPLHRLFDAFGSTITYKTASLVETVGSRESSFQRSPNFGPASAAADGRSPGYTQSTSRPIFLSAIHESSRYLQHIGYDSVGIILQKLPYFEKVRAARPKHVVWVILSVHPLKSEGETIVTAREYVPPALVTVFSGKTDELQPWRPAKRRGRSRTSS